MSDAKIETTTLIGDPGQPGPDVTYFRPDTEGEARYICQTQWGPRFTSKQAREMFGIAQDRETKQVMPFVGISKRILVETEARLVLIEHPTYGPLLLEVGE